MRLTRAALRAGQAHQVDDETDDASKAHTHVEDRVPLGDVSANTAPDADPTDAPAKKMSEKKRKAKGAKKGAKGKEAKAVDAEEDVAPALADEREGAGRPANEAAHDELADEPLANQAQAPVEDKRSATPSRPVRMTRRQLAIQLEDSPQSLRSHDPPQPGQADEDATAAEQEPSLPEPSEPSGREKSSEPLAQLPAEIIPTSTEELVAEPPNVPAPEPQYDAEVQMTLVEPQEEKVQEPSVEAEVQEPDVEVEAEETALPSAEPPAEPPAYETVAPLVEVTQPEPKTLTSKKPHEEEATPATSLTPSRALSRSSTASSSRTPMRLEESISAIDALEDALENVGRDLPRFDQLVEDKSPRKAKFPRSIAPKKTAERTSMAPKISGNPSLAPKSIKPTGLSRSSTVRARPTERKGSGEVVDYLASKRRPISMTFAPPPPPAKSTKPPTTSDFQLPGERIAAELKAKKEERLKRMAEAGPVKQRPISMPPPPKSTRPPTKSDFRLPGEKIAAELKAKKEERLRRMAEGEAPAPRQLNLPPQPKSTKPLTIPNFQLPGEKFAAEQKARKEERLKREAEEAEAAKKTAFKARPAPTHKSHPVVRQTAASQARERLMSKENTSGPTILPLPPQSQRSVSAAPAAKRASIVQVRSVSTSSSTRNSIVAGPGPAKLTPADVAALKNKGREVFNRDKLEKEAREKERREKEEAAKRARAEAAERGRIASREWARKQMEKREEAARRANVGPA